MKKIKAYVKYDDKTKTHYYDTFEIYESLPEIETTKKYNHECVEIKEINIDIENNSEVFDYYFYVVKYIDYEYFNEEDDDNIENYTTYENVAILKDNIEK